MNILVTLNSSYIKQLCVMLHSLISSNPGTKFNLYVMNKSLSQKDYDFLKSKIDCSYIRIFDVKISDKMLYGAPITDRYPYEMYYRLFAAEFLPEDVDKILYLDPDLVVIKPIDKLYNMDLKDNYFAAATHVGRSLTKINEIRLQMDTNGIYINSGVMLMNIALLRKEQNFEDIFDFIKENKNLLFLPDQDIISAVYSDKIVPIDHYVYNMTERLLILRRKVDIKWVCENSAIIHYCGKNKPWKENYIGALGEFYKSYAEEIGL